MTFKVLMLPSWETIRGHAPSGIQAVVKAYAEHLPAYDIELVSPKTMSFDLMAVHAGMSDRLPTGAPLVAHIHGLYWDGDYDTAAWQAKANRDVTASIRHAQTVIVPSEWVAGCLRRDMHMDPVVLGHGIRWDEWQGKVPNGDYVLWNKNRDSDACNPRAVTILARAHPKVRFLTTFADKDAPGNVKAIGLQPHDKMRELVKGAAVYLATTKETFGIGTLEAMAASVPILGFDYGGTASLCRHGVNAYLAQPGDYDDLARGLDYVLQHRNVLARNGREVSRLYRWEEVARNLNMVYRNTAIDFSAPHDVTVVIPCYNKARTLGRAVMSALNQTLAPKEIIVVDNNSTDESWQVAEMLAKQNPTVRLIRESRQGVAHARNAGIRAASTRYICCLDSDDEILPGFLEACVAPLRTNPSLGCTYTRLMAVRPDGSEMLSQWPGEYDYGRFLQGGNQVPTCCVFRRELWQRLGGFRQRYAPAGAGAEDAEFWLRIGASGYGGKLATDEALFRYHLGGSVSANPDYREVDWRAWHPWTRDGLHPFASVAKPQNGLSHPVRPYDQPKVSVVIACAPYHLHTLIDALDSLEAQTFREWEAIVAFDGVPDGEPMQLRRAYPFVRWMQIDKGGAGAARNAGAKVAKAPYLLFLDADDWLAPKALGALYAEALRNPGHIVYSDYLGHAFLDPHERERLRANGRLVAYDEKSNESVIRYASTDYDCEEAHKQPQMRRDGSFYIWNLVSSLVPKSYHDEVGGFDEAMPSWEDWDYWLRISRRGKCFARLGEPLVHYRFYTGQRRAVANPGETGDSGRQLSRKLVEYLQSKYKEDKAMAKCGGCSGKPMSRAAPPAASPMPMMNSARGGMTVSADDIVLVELMDGNIGDHHIAVQQTSYGYRKHGDRFRMLRAHAQLLRPGTYRILTNEDLEPAPSPVREAAAVARPASPPPPVLLRDEGEDAEDLADRMDELVAEGGGTPIMPEVYDFTKIWGIREERAKTLLDAGFRTLSGFLSLDESRLMELFGVSKLQAARMLASAEKLADE